MEEHSRMRTTDAKWTGPEASTNLAAERTRLGYERTMMAWLRTSTSLISFGFTIQKFFQIESKGTSQSEGILGPTNVGRLMILVGLVILILATVQHRRDMSALRKDYPFVPRSMVTWIAAVIALLGILAMISVMMHR